MSSSILGPEWHLSLDGVNIVTENGAIKDTKAAFKKALDCDLKSIGKAALANELSKSKVGKIVLQIQKIRNISAPKSKEESQAAPRMLKLTLTDGESYVQAIELTPLNAISREKTAPGTKVLVNGASIISGYLLISSENFSVLGGQVEHLYDKWILAKSILQSHQHVSNEGAPPWVPFGSKIISANQDRSFKSLEKNKEAESEFDQQRKEAIAEASSGATRKTFGGRVKQNVQPTTNNQHYNRGKPNDRGDNDRGRRGKFASKDDDVVEKFQKPSEKVSLFSFLEDKLPISEPKKPDVPSPSCNKNNCQNYHQRDPRMQQKAVARQYKQNVTNSYSDKEKSSSQGSTNASKTYSKPENHLTSKDLPQKGSNTSNHNSKPSSNEGVNSSYNKKTPNTIEDSNVINNQQKQSKEQQLSQGSQNQYRNNNNNDRSSQPSGANHQYRKSNTDRYTHPSQPTTNNSITNNYYPKDNFPQNHYKNDKYQQQTSQGYSRDNYGYQQNQQMAPYNNTRQQHWNSANHQPPNTTQHNQKPYQNALPQPNIGNAEMHQLANNLSRMSVSNEFASRSLRQHLNLGPPKRPESQEAGLGTLNVGDQCLARYWEDGKFYPAIIAAITDKTYAVQFKGYGNIEEVLKHDCFSAANSYTQQNRNPAYNNYYQNNFSGTSMEFRRRGPPRN